MSTLLAVAIITALCFLVSRASIDTARRLWCAAYLGVVANGVAIMVTYTFLARGGIRVGAPRSDLFAIMDGSAHRPFVFRRLAPSIVGWATDILDRLVPASALDAVLHPASSLAQLYDPKLLLSPHQQLTLYVAYALVWASLLASVWLGADLLRSVRRCSLLEGLVTATLGLALIPSTLGNGGYLYDGLELVLWTALLAALARRNLTVVPFLWCLACLNKETSLVALPALIPWLWAELGSRRALVATGLLGAFGLAWLAYVRAHYAGNPGHAQEWWLWTNLDFWSQGRSYLRFAPLYGPGLPAARGGNVLLLVLVAVPIRFGLSRVSATFRRSAGIASGIMLPCFLANGLWDETRALGPLFPFAMVIGSAGLAHLLDAKPAQVGRVPSAPALQALPSDAQNAPREVLEDGQAPLPDPDGALQILRRRGRSSPLALPGSQET